MKRHHSQCWNADQSWNYGSILLSPPRGELQTVIKIQVRIRRNSYDAQCHCCLDVWSEQQQRWNLVVSQPIEICYCRGLSYVKTSAKDRVEAELAFHKDEARLLEIAAPVLGIDPKVK